MNDLHDDLTARWAPSADQIKLAATTLSSPAVNAWRGQDHALTAHVLVNKHYGFWTADVLVLALPGVFTDRDAAGAKAAEAAEAIHLATGLPVTGGYTYHRADGTWAVFEDILADFSDDARIARREARRAGA